MRKLLLGAVLALTSIASADYFRVQTNPPPKVGSFNCFCNTGMCECKQGEIVIGVSFRTARFPKWKVYASRISLGGFTFHDAICASKCINAISRVTTIRVPYLTADVVEQSLKAVATVRKRSEGHTDKTGYINQTTNTQAEDTISVIREKTTQAVKSNSESLRNDLTLYLLTTMARDFYGRQELFLLDYIYLIDGLSLLSSEGKLRQFLTLYFAEKRAKKAVAFDKLVYEVFDGYEIYAKLYNKKLELYRKEGLPYYVKFDGEGLIITFTSLYDYIDKVFNDEEIKRAYEKAPYYDLNEIKWNFLYSIYYDVLLYHITGIPFVSSVSLAYNDIIQILIDDNGIKSLRFHADNVEGFQKHILKIGKAETPTTEKTPTKTKTKRR